MHTLHLFYRGSFARNRLCYYRRPGSDSRKIPFCCHAGRFRRSCLQLHRRYVDGMTCANLCFIRALFIPILKGRKPLERSLGWGLCSLKIIMDASTAIFFDRRNSWEEDCQEVLNLSSYIRAWEGGITKNYNIKDSNVRSIKLTINDERREYQTL